MSDAAYVAGVVLAYWVISIALVYLNKVLVSDGLFVPAPLFVAWYQCATTVVICWLAGLCGRRARTRAAGAYAPVSTDDGGVAGVAAAPPPGFFAQFPMVEYGMAPARRIFPLSCVFVGMISFNILCLKLVEVSFYNVARSLTVVFNVFFARLFLGIPTSCKTICCLAIVIGGFVVGTHGEINFSLEGTVSGVLSSLFVSLNSIFTKKVLPVVDDNHWKLTFYNNLNASFFFLPLVYWFERDVIINSLDKLSSVGFWAVMSLAGFFGFSIGIVTVLQIKATSPLTHNISGTAKAAVQSLMAFYLWGNSWTELGIFGIFMVLGGSLLYTIVRMSENAQNALSPPPPHQEMPPKV